MLQQSSVPSGCAVLAEVGFLWRWPAFAYLGGIMAWMGANTDGLLTSKLCIPHVPFTQYDMLPQHQITIRN